MDRCRFGKPDPVATGAPKAAAMDVSFLKFPPPPMEMEYRVKAAR